MSGLDDLLGIVDSPEQRRANRLVENDMRMLRSLVELRESEGLTQETVGKRLGLTQPAVAAFERYDNDPKLSTIRRYAHAIGAVISHRVELDSANGTVTSNPSASPDISATGEAEFGIVELAGARLRMASKNLPTGLWVTSGDNKLRGVH